MVKQSNRLMSEFFLELFSEEIPANLQKNSRNNTLLENFKNLFEEKKINLKKALHFQHQIDL